MKTVAVIVQPGFAPFEFGVACEAFGLDRSNDGIPTFDFRILTPEPGRRPFEPRVHHQRRARPVVRVRGRPRGRGLADPREYWARIDLRVLDVVRSAAARGAWLLSVCSGSFVLAASGVLDGRRATTHWMYADTMASMYPEIDVDPDVLYVQDGRIITSAGTAAGLDACLHLLRQELGAEMANTIARRMVVPPQRDGGQAQFILRPLPEVASLSLAPVTDWMLENLRHDLSVDDLAARAHMSPRTFARRFKADHGTTPAAWLNRQRIIHAQRLLEQTDLGLDRIAYECGFGSAAVLRQNFTRTLGTTPTAYRSTFCCTIGMGGPALERPRPSGSELAGSAA